jgi:hypothetical protein
MTDFRDLLREWHATAEGLTSRSASGRSEEARAQLLAGRFADLGSRSTDILNDWTHHNVGLSTAAGNSTVEAIERSRRRYARRDRACCLPPNRSSAAGGPVIGRVDCIGRIRSPGPVHSRCRRDRRIGPFGGSPPQGAAATDEQRWVKSTVAAITRVPGDPGRSGYGCRLDRSTLDGACARRGSDSEGVGLSDEGESGPAGETFDPGAAGAAAARLKTLLESNDGDAMEALADVETAFSGAVDPKLLDTPGAPCRVRLRCRAFQPCRNQSGLRSMKTLELCARRRISSGAAGGLRAPGRRLSGADSYGGIGKAAEMA